MHGRKLILVFGHGVNPVFQILFIGVAVIIGVVLKLSSIAMP